MWQITIFWTNAYLGRFSPSMNNAWPPIHINYTFYKLLKQMDLACESLLPDGYVWTEMKELDKNRKVNKKLFRCSYYMLCISSKPFILSMSYHCYTIRSLEVYGHYPFMEAPFTCKILGWIYVKGRGKPEGSGCQTHLQALHDKATIDSDHIYIKLYLSVKGGNQWWNGKTRSRLLLTIPPYSCPFLVPWDKNWGEIITREHVKHGGRERDKSRPWYYVGTEIS